MSRLILSIGLLILMAGCATQQVVMKPDAVQSPNAIADAIPAIKPAYHYIVDVKDAARNRFYVTLETGELKPHNNQFIFAAVGAFSGNDFRHYVQNFSATDSAGNKLRTRNAGPYRWIIEQPQAVKTISYEVTGTWGKLFEPQVYPMAGTVVKKDLALINGKGVFGLISGRENAAFTIELRTPAHWRFGTALPFENENTILCKNFSTAISTPILMGDISSVNERILGADISLHTYSRSNSINSEDLLEPVDAVIRATHSFMGELPANEATMLFIFDEKHAGGVQFRNSSAFVFKDAPFANIRQRVQDVIAHEFFHLFIPFSIRSDALDDANLFTARPSGHLWFFEGVTEWASDMLQVHAGLKTINQYLGKDFRDKLFQEDFFPGSVSLYNMSIQKKRQQQDYLSVYSRGALVAALFDIHLLERTFGNRSLRDVLRDLHLDYGVDRPLPEERFFQILREYSGPEFEDFIANYIVGNQPLPVQNVLAGIGLQYKESDDAGSTDGDPGIVVIPGERALEIVWIDQRRANENLRRGDIVLEIDRRRATPANLDALLERVRQRSVGSSFDLRIKRGKKRIDITLKSLTFRYRHVMTFPRTISPAQETVLRRWQGLAN